MVGKKKVRPERKRQRFSQAFKLEAVRLLELGQKPATQLAVVTRIGPRQPVDLLKQRPIFGLIFRLSGTFSGQKRGL
jgi:hypothetical protein